MVVSSRTMVASASLGRTRTGRFRAVRNAPLTFGALLMVFSRFQVSQSGGGGGEFGGVGAVGEGATEGANAAMRAASHSGRGRPSPRMCSDGSTEVRASWATSAQVASLSAANPGSRSSGQVNDCRGWLMSTPEISYMPWRVARSWMRRSCWGCCAVACR